MGLRGKAIKDLDFYAKGTNFVKKDSVDRHLRSKTHTFAVDLERDKVLCEDDAKETVVEADADSRYEQSTSSSKDAPKTYTNIKSALATASKDAYTKLVTDAYILAVDGAPLSFFRTIVRAQKATGTRLIKGIESHKSARHFILAIATAIRQKIKKILISSNAFSLLSDGSQARKTGSEKELVLARLLKDGLPTYVIVALQDIDSYGSANADNIKLALDDAFVKKLDSPKEKYVSMMVAATADGASVNMGQYNGVLVQLVKDSRPWLLKIHCVSHRAELGIKDSMANEKSFEPVKETLQGLYQFSKQSGKFKAQFKATADALDVQTYNFPKATGTRFISHHMKAIDHLIKNWIPLLQAIENSIANEKDSKVNAKLRGFRSKLTDIKFLTTCIIYREVVTCLAMLSKKFERELVLVCDVKPVVEKCLSDLEDVENCPSDLKNLLKQANMELTVTDAVQDTGRNGRHFKLCARLPKKGHTRRKPDSREYQNIDYECDATGLKNAEIPIEEYGYYAVSLKCRVIKAINGCLKRRFAVETGDTDTGDCRENDLNEHMRIVTNPANWVSTKRELHALGEICDHFNHTLSSCTVAFDRTRVEREWKDLKILVNRNYNGVGPLKMWEKIFQYKRPELPNLCVVIEILLCIGVSNCQVERGFSILTNMLSDRRLLTNHETMEALLLIKGHNAIWTEQEREELIQSAVEIYISTASRRKVKLEESGSINPLHYAPRKRKYIEVESESNSESEGDTDYDIDTETDSDAPE